MRRVFMFGGLFFDPMSLTSLLFLVALGLTFALYSLAFCHRADPGNLHRLRLVAAHSYFHVVSPQFCLAGKSHTLLKMLAD